MDLHECARSMLACCSPNKVAIGVPPGPMRRFPASMRRQEAGGRGGGPYDMQGSVWLQRTWLAVTGFRAAPGAARTWPARRLANCTLGPCSACVLYIDNLGKTGCAKCTSEAPVHDSLRHAVECVYVCNAQGRLSHVRCCVPHGPGARGGRRAAGSDGGPADHVQHIARGARQHHGDRRLRRSARRAALCGRARAMHLPVRLPVPQSSEGCCGMLPLGCMPCSAPGQWVPCKRDRGSML